MLFSLSTERNFTNVIRNTPENVGPGAYETTAVMGNRKKMKAPFGTRSSRDFYPKPDMEPPAPGEYEAKPLGANIAITSVFSSETKRTVFDRTNNPGPGEYGDIKDWTPRRPREIHHKRPPTSPIMTGYVGQDVYGYTLEDGKWVPMRSSKHGPEWVGPGSYDPKLIGREYSVSMEKSSNRDIFGKIPGYPGPGQYEPMNRKEKIPVSISNLPRGSGDQDGGSPAWVEPRKWAARQSEGSPAFRSREKRSVFDGQEGPSPAAYHREKRVRCSQGDGFGHKQARNFGTPLNDDPGPGTYDPKGVKWVRSSKSAMARHVERRENPNDWVPGPGAYQTERKSQRASTRPSSAFKSRTKREQEKPPPYPGPDAYSPKILDSVGKVAPLIRESRFAKVGDWLEQSKLDNPAPDVYQHVKIKPGKGRSISRTYRDEIDKDQFPGPGTYNVRHSSLRTKCLNARAPVAPDED